MNFNKLVNFFFDFPAVLFIEAGWLSAGVVWFYRNYFTCQIKNTMTPRETVLGMVIFNWCILFSVLITVWCTYDAAGRSWVKMKQYQRSMRASESKFQYRRSGSTRNWRQRYQLKKKNHKLIVLFQKSLESVSRQLATALPLPLLLFDSVRP